MATIIPTLPVLRLMPVDKIHALLLAAAQQNAALIIELDLLRHWRQERGAMLRQTARLHRQIGAMGNELQRWKDGKA